MSPNVSNFVHDLVEMAQATQRLPELQAELDQARNELSVAFNTIQDRELSILKLKEEINALHDSLRNAEVARDHAETMFLEADDRADKALAFVRGLRSNIEGLLTAFEPVVPMPPEPAPAPTPVAVQGSEQVPTGGVAQATEQSLSSSQWQPEANPTQASPSSISEGSVASSEAGQSEPLPTVSASPSGESTYATGSEPSASAQAVSGGTQAEGQREVNPTSAARTIETNPGTVSSTATVPGTVSSTEGASPRPTSPAYGGDTSVGSDAMPARETVPSSSPDPFRYAGKLYMRVTGWVSRSDWLSGGGSNETYDWREGMPLPEGVA